MQKCVLTLAVLMALAGAAHAGDRTRDHYAAPPIPGTTRYYGPVTNYYGAVTIYAGSGESTEAATGFSVTGAPYGYGYATAPERDSNSYGAGYDRSHAYGYSCGSGYAYPSCCYGYGSLPTNEGQRLDPWAGYNGGFGNGYW